MLKAPVCGGGSGLDVASRAPFPATSRDDLNVILSIGGQRFETTRATLTRVPETYFSAMADWPTPPDGVFRIDRSPRVFDLILEYLRHGLEGMLWPADAWQEGTALHLLVDATFFLLPELSDLLLRVCLLKGWGICGDTTSCASVFFSRKEKMACDAIALHLATDDAASPYHALRCAPLAGRVRVAFTRGWLSENFPLVAKRVFASPSGEIDESRVASLSAGPHIGAVFAYIKLARGAADASTPWKFPQAIARDGGMRAVCASSMALADEFALAESTRQYLLNGK